MSRNARIEEVSDSDPDDMDLVAFDPRNAAAAPPPYAASTHTADRSFPTPAARAQQQQQHLPTPAFSSSDPSTQYVNAGDAAAYKSYQCLYPVYFDVSRTRRTGRRVSAALAVANPLARGLVDACAALQLKTVFEPGKTHPQDWANPGRVRVLLSGSNNPTVPNKFVLYRKVGEFLRGRPTTAQDPLKLRLPNMPFDGGKPPLPVAVPRGWKMGTILPLHSAALSGGGVSDDIFKEMMRDMGVPGMEGGGGGGAAEGGQVVKEKKEKKEKKKGKR